MLCGTDAGCESAPIPNRYAFTVEVNTQWLEKFLTHF